MKRLFLIIALMMTGIIFITSCGGGGPKKKLTEKGELLCSKAWKLQVNDVLKDVTNQLDSATNIDANIKLDGDVGKLAEFFAETLTFGHDTKHPEKLSYERKIGEGFLSTSVLGWWDLNADESGIVMREWDDNAGKEKEPVTYKIVKLTTDELIIQKEGDVVPNYYKAK